MGLDCSSFGLGAHETPNDFTTSFWQKNPKMVHGAFLAYRIVMCLFVLANYVAYFVLLEYSHVRNRKKVRCKYSVLPCTLTEERLNADM